MYVGARAETGDRQMRHNVNVLSLISTRRGSGEEDEEGEEEDGLWSKMKGNSFR